MNFKRIEADIKMAKYEIDPVTNPSNDEFLYDLSAYHTQQAIEKELKYILRNIYGADDTERRFKTHNISSLLIRVNEYDKDFLDNHSKLIDLADELTNWEASSRYGENIVSTRENIIQAINCAKELQEEIIALQNFQINNKISEVNISELSNILDDEDNDIDEDKVPTIKIEAPIHSNIHEIHEHNQNNSTPNKDEI